MKLFSLLVLFSLAACFVKAQDTIIRRSGDTLVVKITEVNPYDIRYVMLNYLDGPVFNVFKEDLKEIRYGNGYRESFENYIPPYRAGKPDPDLRITYSAKHFYYKEHRVSEADMLGIASRLDDRRLNGMVRRIEGTKLLQNITFCAATIAFVSGAYIYRANTAIRGRRIRGGTTTNTKAQKNGVILMLCGLGTGLITVSLYIDRRRNDRLLVNAYNSTIYKR